MVKWKKDKPPAVPPAKVPWLPPLTNPNAPPKGK